MTSVTEEHELLSWNQMGGRKRRSTLSAIDLLTACVETAWKTRPGCVVSILSLDISGAYPSVSHIRLLGVLREKGFPQWIIRFVRSFLQGRRTKVAFQWIRKRLTPDGNWNTPGVPALTDSLPFVYFRVA